MFKAGIKHTEPVTVAFLTMKGAYHQIPEGYDKLYDYVNARDFTASGPPRAVYLTPPDVPEADAMWELRAPIADQSGDEGPDEHGLGVKHVPGRKVAWAMHLGPYDTVGSTYEELMQWIASEGLGIAGPSEEIYFSDPDEVPAEEYLTEISFPVAGV